MDTTKKLIEILAGFDSAMLVTQRPDGQLAARPMAVAQVTDDGGIWFITEGDSGKMNDLAVHREVCVTMQGGKQFASLCGTVEVSADRGKIEELWNEAWRVWFPEGKDDPRLVLLHVVPSQGEYWDNSGMEGIKYMLEAGKAYLQGKTPEVDESTHARVSLR
ncbi:MAG: pyridoxamine 5'-phosphate oxidase family protein [Planctomycetaceae bacterium]